MRVFLYRVSSWSNANASAALGGAEFGGMVVLRVLSPNVFGKGEK
jgi:hypothetical protein